MSIQAGEGKLPDIIKDDHLSIDKIHFSKDRVTPVKL
jgi:hypothetical protein